jgi:hypothetical protein
VFYKFPCNLNEDLHSSIYRYRQIGIEIQDALILILDEVSMIGLEDLHYISSTLQKARATLFKTMVEKEAILAAPFGGLHVIFAGDLYQLPAIRKTAIQSVSCKSYSAEQGKLIWNSINSYIKFVINHRVNQNDLLETQFAATLSLLREGGNPAAKGFLDYINGNNLAVTDEECIVRAHPVCTSIFHHPTS